MKKTKIKILAGLAGISLLLNPTARLAGIRRRKPQRWRRTEQYS
ncbi:hypothetical protein [Paenibacillus sp. ATY16]|nr:hypothetical protein [Paenibacillus sp. ATY16]